MRKVTKVCERCGHDFEIVATSSGRARWCQTCRVIVRDEYEAMRAEQRKHSSRNEVARKREPSGVALEVVNCLKERPGLTCVEINKMLGRSGSSVYSALPNLDNLMEDDNGRLYLFEPEHIEINQKRYSTKLKGRRL